MPKKKSIENSTIFCADNINVLKQIEDNSIDLIYLDPPFNKKRDFYGIKKTISASAFFNDVWNIKDIEAEESYIEKNNVVLYNFLKNTEYIYDKSARNFLTYIGRRIIEMRRVLKNTGSICLHSDYSMSHYLKILLDIIFGSANFRNEIIWCYKQGGRSNKTLAKKHDTIFWYSKTNKWIFNGNDIRTEYDEGSMYAKSGIKNPKTGKVYMPNPNGKIPEDFWYIPALNPLDKERTGYPTQKPIILIERIIKMLSPANGFTLDPFCGSGTTCIAAEKLDRQWIGIDISKEACSVAVKRIKKETNKNIEIIYVEEK